MSLEFLMCPVCGTVAERDHWDHGETCCPICDSGDLIRMRPIYDEHRHLLGYLKE